MKWLLNRLTEPSTWAGLAGLLPAALSLGAGAPSPEMIGAFVAGLAAVLMKEQGRGTP